MPEPAQPKILHAANADIQFENVDFSYGEKPVLRNINLAVKAGQLVAFTIEYHGIPAAPAGSQPANGRENPGLRIVPNKYGEWSAFSENWPSFAPTLMPLPRLRHW